MTNLIREEIKKIQTTNRAQHDRIKTVLSLICDEIDKMSKPLTAQQILNNRKDIKKDGQVE